MVLYMGILGSALGSFLALIIHRLPLGQSIVTPRSHCASCQRPLKIWHNIPIISWLLLCGRCGYCKAFIGLRPLFIEVLCGLCLSALYVKLGLSIALFDRFCFFFILVAILYIDMDYFWLPYSLLLSLFLLGILTSTIYYFYPQAYMPLNKSFGIFSALIFKPSVNFSLSSRLWAATLSGLFFALINVSVTFVLRKSARLLRTQWAMGWGDPLLVFGIGLTIGLSHMALVIFLASFIGSIFGLAKRKEKSESDDIAQGAVPFGPFLAIAAIYIYLF